MIPALETMAGSWGRKLSFILIYLILICLLGQIFYRICTYRFDLLGMHMFIGHVSQMYNRGQKYDETASHSAAK